MKNKLTLKAPEYPFSIGWSITNCCNLHCIHCNMNSGNKLKDELTTKECKKVIDELSKNRVQKIMFSGGEPLIRKDFFEIANYAFKKGIIISLTTNSLLITEDIIKNELYKFEIVRVSLDGSTQELHEFIRNKSGIFDLTIEKVNKMVKNGIDVGIVTCVSKKNMKDLSKMAELLEKIKIKRWYLPLLSPNGRGKNIFKEALEPNEVKQFLITMNELAKKVSFEINLDIPYQILLEENLDKIKAACPAAISDMVILSNGDLTPCCQIPGNGNNCLKEGISYVWNNDSVFKAFRDRTLLKGKCSKCECIMSCGGCRANAYIMYNNYLEEDGVCWKK